jgi:hypothetical protein
LPLLEELFLMDLPLSGSLLQYSESLYWDGALLSFLSEGFSLGRFAGDVL